MTQRGDLVTVSLQGDYGKPRPALVVHSDLLADLESVMLCPITSELHNASFRITVEPNPVNGLRALSQVMTDKLSTVSRTQIGPAFGSLDKERMRAVCRLQDNSGTARKNQIAEPSRQRQKPLTLSPLPLHFRLDLRHHGQGGLLAFQHR